MQAALRSYLRVKSDIGSEVVGEVVVVRRSAICWLQAIVCDKHRETRFLCLCDAKKASSGKLSGQAHIKRFRFRLFVAAYICKEFMQHVIHGLMLLRQKICKRATFKNLSIFIMSCVDKRYNVKKYLDTVLLG